jgi:hypothetical protein
MPIFEVISTLQDAASNLRPPSSITGEMKEKVSTALDTFQNKLDKLREGPSEFQPEKAKDLCRPAWQVTRRLACNGDSTG